MQPIRCGLPHYVMLSLAEPVSEHRLCDGCWGPDGPLEGLSEDASPPWQYDLRGRGLGPGSTAPGRSVYVGDSLGDIQGLLEVCVECPCTTFRSRFGSPGSVLPDRMDFVSVSDMI